MRDFLGSQALVLEGVRASEEPWGQSGPEDEQGTVDEPGTGR